MNPFYTLILSVVLFFVIIMTSLGIPIASKFILFGVSFIFLIAYTLILKYRKKYLPGWLIGTISLVPIILLILDIVDRLFPDSYFFVVQVHGFIMRFIPILLIIGFVIYFLKNKTIGKKYLLIYVGLFFFTLNSLFISSLSAHPGHINIIGTCLEEQDYQTRDYSRLKTKSLVYNSASCNYSDSFRLLFIQKTNTLQIKEYVILLISIVFSLYIQILFYKRIRKDKK